YLRKRRSAWLALGAIVLTVFIPIVVLGVMQGFVDVMARQVRSTESDLTCAAGFFELGIPDHPEQRAALAGVDGVVGVGPFITSHAMLTPRRGDGKVDFRYSVPCLVDAIEWDADRALGRLSLGSLHRTPDLDLRQPPLPPERRGTGFLTMTWRSHLALIGGGMIAGLGPLPLPPRSTPSAGAIVGQELAYFAELSTGGPGMLGTRIQVLVPNGSGGATGRVQLEISDTIGTGIYEVDRYNLIVPLGYGRRLADLGPAAPGADPLVTGFRVRIADDRPLDEMAHRVAEASGLQTQTWMQRRVHLVKSLVQQRNLIGLMMILVQCLTVFIVYAVFSTLVAEKRHDIGVLLGIGARPSQITGAFLVSCVAACVFGGLLGWAMGWGLLLALNPLCDYFGIALFPQDFFYSPDTPISMNPLIPLFFMGVMTTVALLAAAIPALRAGRVDPVQILREGG
ncbi:MAG: ABC transporter permease, partial [Planctomycetes bacterium]|nr:ABC transporter permease [Planctomycetota bacterium]